MHLFPKAGKFWQRLPKMCAFLAPRNFYSPLFVNDILDNEEHNGNIVVV